MHLLIFRFINFIESLLSNTYWKGKFRKKGKVPGNIPCGYGILPMVIYEVIM